METKSNYKQELISILIEINCLVTEHLKVQKSVLNPPIRARILTPFKKIILKTFMKRTKKSKQSYTKQSEECTRTKVN